MTARFKFNILNPRRATKKLQVREFQSPATLSMMDGDEVEFDLPASECWDAMIDSLPNAKPAHAGPAPVTVLFRIHNIGAANIHIITTGPGNRRGSRLVVPGSSWAASQRTLLPLHIQIWDEGMHERILAKEFMLHEGIDPNTRVAR